MQGLPKKRVVENMSNQGSSIHSFFKDIKDFQKRNLYNEMWGNNDFVCSEMIEKTFVKGNDVLSDNSFSFRGESKNSKKDETLIKIFAIENEELFKEKFCMACGGSGQEHRRITTLHSSSLCPLLFFYNVTDKNRLIIDGIGTFTESVYEFKSQVVDSTHPSCMDVVLKGTDINGNPIVLFLESKFSEYYVNASKKACNLSKKYLENEFSECFYKESDFLETIGLEVNNKDDDRFDLKSPDVYYIGGIKQMISHYVGIRNTLESIMNERDSEIPIQKSEKQQNVIEWIKNGAKVILAEILFDPVIGGFTLYTGETYKDAYSKKYEILAKKMNEEIKKASLEDKFEVYPTDLGYSMFLSNSFVVESNIRKFYFNTK